MPPFQAWGPDVDHLTVRTSVADFALVGRIHADRRRPTLLMVNGSFPIKNLHHDLVDDFGGANVLVVEIPGMLGTAWSGRSARELGRGLDELADRLVGGQPIVAVGSSTGNLLTMSMRHPDVQHRIAIEPFFQTKDLWPFQDWSQKRMARTPDDKDLLAFMWDFFGFAPDRLENRDYRDLIDGVTTPTDVFTGSLPLLPIRQTDQWPSFTSQEDRAALAANPFVTHHEGPPNTGHSVFLTYEGGPVGRKIILAALLRAAKLCRP